MPASAANRLTLKSMAQRGEEPLNTTASSTHSQTAIPIENVIEASFCRSSTQLLNLTKIVYGQDSSRLGPRLTAVRKCGACAYRHTLGL